MAILCGDDKCTLCLACFNVCPFDAINLVTNELSMTVPRINLEKCRDCGLCERTCPELNYSKLHFPTDAIALYTKNEEDRATCSSGGAATAFAKTIINCGGVVYGVSARNSYPEFVRVTTLAGLERLKGSKYVYGGRHYIYRQVKNDLDDGVVCLFIGLPCDVAGLRNYLRKSYANLYTMDLICHGTPPFEYLKAHIDSKIANYTSDCSVSFRGVGDFFTIVRAIDDTIMYCQNQYEDEYFCAFMRGIIYKPTCYKCRYARPERVSDLTVGDFWGLSKDALDGFDGKVSVVLINTPQGADLFEKVKEAVEWEYRTVNEAIAGNTQLHHATPNSVAAEKFRNAYAKTQSIVDAFRVCGIKRIVRRNKVRRQLLVLPKAIRNIIRRWNPLSRYQLSSRP